MFSRIFRLLPVRLLAIALSVILLCLGYAYLRSSVADAEGGAENAANQVIDAKASLSASAQPLASDLTCFNVNSVQIQSWHSTDFLSAAGQLRPKVLRVPGGEVANYWDWRRGGIIEDASQMPDGLPEYMRYGAQDNTNSKLEDYKVGLAATNSQALFVLNMLTSDLGDQIDMLSAAAKAGIEIKYLELGNEYYFGIPNYAHRFPTPESYGEEAKVWIGYLKDIFPGIEVAVFGVVPKPNSSPRELQWNQALMRTALPVADAIALHLYPTPGLDPNGFSDSGYPAFDENDFATIFGEPFRYWAAMRDRPAYDIIPNDKEIWITEFNLIEDVFGDNSSRRPRVMGTWGHGLYALAMNLMFLEESRVKMTCNHDLVEDFKFGAILPHENSFRLSDEQTYPVTPMSLSATGQALSLLGETSTGMNQAQALSFTESPRLTGKEGFTYSALYGWRFDRSSSSTSDSKSAPVGAVVMNLSDNVVQLDVADIVSNSVHYQQLSADPRTLVTDAYSLTVQKGTTDGAIALPPHSVTQLLSP